MDPYGHAIWQTKTKSQNSNIKPLAQKYSNLVDSPTNIHTCQSIPTQQPAFVVKNFQQGILKKPASEHESSPSKTWRTFVLTTTSPTNVK